MKPTSKRILICLRTDEALEEINSFYALAGYKGNANPGDTLYLAKEDHRLIGAVRIVEESGQTVLRGMYIHPEYRGMGLGAKLLNRIAPDLDQQNRVCYAIPHDHLLDFYGMVGFQSVSSSEVPEFLASRYQEYLAQGLKVKLIKREVSVPMIRMAKAGDEAPIHEAHMKSIREICVKDHGESEIRGWGYRELGDRWQKQISEETTWVVEQGGKICGVGYIAFNVTETGECHAYLHALYLTPEVLGKGLGKKLLSQLIKVANKKNAVLVKLESSITARGFYRAHGFQDREEMKLVEIGGYPVRAFPMILFL